MAPQKDFPCGNEVVAGRYENLPKPLRERGMRQAVMGESKRWQVFVPLGFRQALPSFGGAWRGLSFLIIHRLNSPIRRKKNAGKLYGFRNNAYLCRRKVEIITAY